MRLLRLRNLLLFTASCVHYQILRLPGIVIFSGGAAPYRCDNPVRAARSFQFASDSCFLVTVSSYGWGLASRSVLLLT